ncbi:MAG TPA: caspase family protein [Saprospiraceae bacterium]|nr:caspase family protein [Saprospiraceae bacterium]HMQ83665.1 caspase family protein [Saprospiraceae bacterium]
MQPILYALYSLLLTLPVILVAQPDKPDWEHRFGGGAEDAFFQVMEASNGYIVAVGETQSDAFGKSDGLLVILDHSTGRKIVEKKLGGAKADGLRAAVQLPDGHFMLAGFTESIGNGKSDAWLVKIDENGNLVWESAFGGSDYDSFSHLILLPNGILAGIGKRDNGAKGDIWLTQIQEQTLIQEHQIGKGQYDGVKGVVRSADGQIVVAGNTGGSSKSGKGDAFLIKVEPGGRLIWEKSFGDKEWEEATHLIAAPDGGYALAGLTRSNTAGAMDFWLIKTNSAGFQQWQKTYGGKDDDVAHTLGCTTDGGFLMGGYSKSYHSGARSFKGFFVKTDAGGALQWEWPYGGSKDDAVNHLAVLHDGRAVAVGQTASDAKGANDAWIMCLTDQSQTPLQQLAGIKEDLLERSSISLKTADGKLRPGERSYLSFSLSNQTQVNIRNLQIKVEQNSGSSGLRFWPENYLGSLSANATQEINIPVYGAADLATADNQLKITVTSGNQELSVFETNFRSLQPQDAGVEVEDFSFEDSRSSDEEKLKLVLHNPGDFTAKSVVVRFEPPLGIQAISATELKLAQIGPHASQAVEFIYKRTATYRSSQLAIPCTVDFNGQKIRKTLERGAAMGNEVFMVLTQPNETKTDIQNMVSDKGVFDVQVAVGSNTALQQKNFKVLNNNMVVDGSKMDEVSLSNSSSATNKHAYVYNNSIHLQPGENRLEIEVETPEGQFRTKTIIVRYEPKQPNLHILTIGPSHKDLQYTSKDAADFAAAFENQGGSDKLYGKVFIRSLVLPDETEADDIREAVADLVYQYENATAAQRILDQDVLLIFISSHGKNSREGFQLLPSNYDARYERIRSIDFQRDIVQELERIRCKKAVFIDACHSGAADSKAMTDMERADALNRLAALHPGLNTMASCGANEMSYEDAFWQNGAFTEAILEAFSNTSVEGPNGSYQADADANSIITLAELYDYLRQRVPDLVKLQKPTAPTHQIPFMPGNETEARQLPIYVVD